MNDPPPPAAGPPGVDEPDLVVELNALLGRGTHYDGNLAFEGRVRIEGRFTGRIRGDVLIVGEGAEIEGDIEVGTCIVTGGHVEAQIRAREGIELHAPATVRGDLHAPNVFIDRGVQFEGGCKMAPLEDQLDESSWEQDVRRVSEPVEAGAIPAHVPLPDDGPVLDAGGPDFPGHDL